MRRFRIPLLPWKSSKSYIFLCVCVSRGGGCTGPGVCLLLIQLATRRHISISGLWLHHILRHYLIKATIFWKKLLNKICVFWFFSTTVIWNISHSYKNSVRYCHECENIFIQNARYFCRIVMKLDVSRQSFEKSSNIKFHQNSSSGSRIVPWGRTDRRTDMKLLVAFRNFAKAPKNKRCKQDRQRTCNVRLWRVCSTVFAMESQQCVSSTVDVHLSRSAVWNVFM